jgi:hypothetical protein
MMATPTARFAQLLIDAARWDKRFPNLCPTQRNWLIENFCYDDNLSRYVDFETRRKWDIPRLAGKYLYTVCA